LDIFEALESKLLHFEVQFMKFLIVCGATNSQRMMIDPNRGDFIYSQSFWA